MIYFETERLFFRDWREQDLNEFQIMNIDTRVMKYFKRYLQKRRQINFTSEFKMNLKIVDMAFMRLKQNIITALLALLASIGQTSFHNRMTRNIFWGEKE